MAIIPEYDAYAEDCEELLEEKQKIIADLLEACKDLIDAIEPMLKDPGLSPSQRAGFPTYAIEQAKKEIAKAEGDL